MKKFYNDFRFFTIAFVLGLGFINSSPTDDNEGLEDDFTTNIVTSGGYFPGNRCVFPWEFRDANGKIVTLNACKPFEDEPKPFLSGVDGADPYSEPSVNASRSTNGILSWCPHNYDDPADSSKRFFPGDEYATTDSKEKRHWGFCTCEAESFWQRLPEFDNSGALSTQVQHSRRLNTQDCLLNTSRTRRERKFYSIDCKQWCDSTQGCNGFEYMRDDRFNYCNILSCIQVVADRPPAGVIKYKKQVKRPCAKATENLILNEGDSFPLDIVTNAPTNEPTNLPTAATRSPEMLSTSNPTSAPTSKAIDTAAPSSQPTQSQTGNQGSLTSPPTGGEVSPAAWAVPLALIIAASAVIGFLYAKRRHGEEAVETSVDDSATKSGGEQIPEKMERV